MKFTFSKLFSSLIIFSLIISVLLCAYSFIDVMKMETSHGANHSFVHIEHANSLTLATIPQIISLILTSLFVLVVLSLTVPVYLPVLLSTFIIESPPPKRRDLKRMFFNLLSPPVIC